MKTKTFKTKEDVKKAFKKEGIEVFSYAESLIDSKDCTLEKAHDFEYVILTPKDLGFTEYPTTTELFAKAQEQGYDLLLPIEALSITLEILQDKGELAYFAMNPITDSGGRPLVFDVGRDGGGDRWLDADWVYPDDTWYLDLRIVFRLRKGSLNSETRSLGNGTLDTLNLDVFGEINQKLDRIINHLGVK